MKKVSAVKGILLSVMGFIFIACLIIMTVFINQNQTRIFWDHQQDLLAMITERCKVQLGGWVDMQVSIVTNVQGEYLSGRLRDKQTIEGYLHRIVEENAQLVSAYIVFGNSLYYFGGVDPSRYHAFTDEEWYREARTARGEIVFSEPYLEPLSGEVVVSCLKSFKSSSGNNGVIGVDISTNGIASMVDELTPSRSGGAYLISRNGKVITYLADPEVMPRIENNVAFFTDRQAIFDQVQVLDRIEKYEKNGIRLERILDYDDREKYETTITVPQTGWMLGVNIPLSDYDEAVAAVVRDQMPVVICAVLMSLVCIVVAGIVVFESRESRNLRRDMEMARVASQTKSDFLSRMSHEMRTPMNAIIGMTKIADGTVDVDKLKHCLETIDGASRHLLGIINDVLDMSKIEAGKFDLDASPFNVEKMLMRICNLIVEKTETKRQRLSVVFGTDTSIHFVGDEQRLSQVITNLLSNAVKFTPEGGEITLGIYEMERNDDYSIMRFSVRDTGIGISDEQLARLFQSFEQADGSISRRFGGTGLGLVISKSIIEKMGGRIWVESELGKGSDFIFEVKLTRSLAYHDTIIFDGISPSDLRMLLVDEHEATRKRIRSITDSFGVQTDEADSGKQAIHLVETAKETHSSYDVILLDYDMAEWNGIETLKRISPLIDKNTVIIMTSFLEWNKIEKEAKELGVTRYLAKPLFPSSILDSIVDVVGRTAKNLELQAQNAPDEIPDLSGIQLLVAEDVEINREILLSLLEPTHVKIDIAENGREAVEAFRENPGKYRMIIMDIQMPEMDGFEATRTIRALDRAEAKEIPIVAMTANVFKEDIDRCLESGMNDHLPKPIDAAAIMEKILFYTGKGRA